MTTPRKTDSTGVASVIPDDPKITLRRELLETRSRVPERQAAAIAVAANLRAALTPVADSADKIVGGYIAIGDELDCHPALAIMAAIGARICLPVVGPRGQRLFFRQWQPGELLISGPLGTSHPSSDALNIDPDVLLVPLVAFDRRGHRLGRGGGYYDRTLAALRAERRVLAVGLAFDVQEIPEVPEGPNDQVLDMVVTERRTLFAQPQLTP